MFKGIKKYAFLIICIITSCLIYLPSRHYGLVADFINWIYKYDTIGVEGLKNCFGYPGLHHLFHFLNFTIYSIISANTTAWYLLSASLHGVNSFLLFNLCKKTLATFDSNGLLKTLPFWVSLLFLISPFNIEAVVWKACLHYLISTALLLIGLINVLQYLKTESKNSAFTFNICFIACLFILEISFVFPIIYLFYVILIGRLSQQNLMRKYWFLALSQVVILISYLFLSKIFIGEFIGHYGADKHLAFDFNLIIGNYGRYFIKHVFFIHFLSFEVKSFFYNNALSSGFVLGILSLAGSMVLYLVFYNFKKISRIHSFAWLNLILFFVGITPIITLYFYWQHPFENERYSYFANVFFIQSAVAFMFLIKNKGVRVIMLIVYAAIHSFLFGQQITNTQKAGFIQHSLLSDFIKFNEVKDDIAILSIPDNFKGMYLFRDHNDNVHIFKKSLYLMYKVRFQNNFIGISQFNQNEIIEGVNATKTSDSKIKVGFNQFGNWFWRKGIGLSGYENTNHKITVNDNVLVIDLVDTSLNTTYFYPVNNTWQKLDHKSPN